MITLTQRAAAKLRDQANAATPCGSGESFGV